MQEETEDGEVRFDLDHFWEWSGSCWRKVDEGEIRKRIAERYGHLAAAKRWSDVRGILQVMGDLARKDLVEVPEAGINFANGFLTEDLRLQQHDRAYGATYTLEFQYSPNLASLEHAPKWKDLLETAWGADADYEDKVKALQQAMCLTMFGKATDLQRAILLLGPGGTGKTQTLEVMRALMPPETISNSSPTDWGSDRFATAGLAGKLLNVCGELSESQMIDGRAFKGIISGDHQEAQHKGRNRFGFKPKAANWFASNWIPKTKDTSSGFNRRWLILVYNHPVPVEKRVLNLAELIVSQEREAIVAWAVSSLPEILGVNEYTLPESHKQKVQDLAAQNNSVYFFLHQSGRVLTGPTALEQSNGARISADELYTEFESFCRREGFVRAAGRPRFLMAMNELQHELKFEMVKEPSSLVTGIDKWWFNGITLAP
jgi:P4 family phage/plasmid primase-like protien